MHGKLDAVVDQQRRKLFRVFNWLLANASSSYCKFVVMQSRGVPTPMLFQIYSNPQYNGIECALWPTFYPTTAMYESFI